MCVCVCVLALGLSNVGLEKTSGWEAVVGAAAPPGGSAEMEPNH